MKAVGTFDLMQLRTNQPCSSQATCKAPEEGHCSHCIVRKICRHRPQANPLTLVGVLNLGHNIIPIYYQRRCYVRAFVITPEHPAFRKGVSCNTYSTGRQELEAIWAVSEYFKEIYVGQKFNVRLHCCPGYSLQLVWGIRTNIRTYALINIE